MKRRVKPQIAPIKRRDGYYRTKTQCAAIGDSFILSNPTSFRFMNLCHL
jgi:hypothetical protein